MTNFHIDVIIEIWYFESNVFKLKVGIWGFFCVIHNLANKEGGFRPTFKIRVKPMSGIFDHKTWSDLEQGRNMCLNDYISSSDKRALDERLLAPFDPLFEGHFSCTWYLLNVIMILDQVFRQSQLGKEYQRRRLTCFYYSHTEFNF